MSKCIIIVGATGSGKTTLTRKMLKDVNPKLIHVFDINSEEIWSDCVTYRNMLPEEYKEMLMEKKPGYYLIEDASSIFQPRGTDTDLKRLLVQKRHNNQFYILLFHSLRQIPNWILDFSDTLILGHTRDNKASAQKLSYDEITDAWEDLRENRHVDFKFHKIDL